ncbi:MAG: PQQ-dependent sugar dehydrogenase, partial [Actinomycetota bacterium]|nr:PQQ-dependent sugar dehydrogenase [Actinomycetota bacterium]
GKACGDAGLGPRPQLPLISWTPPIAPTDPWFYNGSIDSFVGDIFVGDFNTGRLHRLSLNQAGTAVVRHSVVHDFDRQIADVSEGPGGFLYVLTIDSIKRFVGRGSSNALE